MNERALRIALHSALYEEDEGEIVGERNV